MGSLAPDLTSRLFRRQRTAIATAVALLVGLSWWFLASGAGMPKGMGAMPMPQPPLGALVLMWWLMMLAMMLPSAAPMILLYARVQQQRRDQGEALVQPWLFALGYIAVWLLFSIAAAALQQQLAPGSGMALADAPLAAAVVIAAGLYQLSPMKNACLQQCRSPAQFLSRYWRPGPAGALRTSLIHGAYCVGCCWLLMALLFVGGIMNFAWIAALTLLVAIEKLLPGGQVVGRIVGVGLISWGAVSLASAL